MTGINQVNAPWVWIDRRVLMLLHDESVALHGGASGIRDAALLDSALARPEQLVAYTDQPDATDTCALAACYAFGIVRNHPFVDGNKRAALLSVGLFFYDNGRRLTATQEGATLQVLGLAAGDVSEAEFANWLRANSRVTALPA
jgi:death on curing protein